jgi:large subunit ribosomal protein L15
MPLIRRIPKRGFNNARFATKHFPVNLVDLDSAFADGETVDLDILKGKGLVGSSVRSIKILANGSLSRKLNVKACAFSVKAKTAIEAVGGQATLI